MINKRIVVHTVDEVLKAIKEAKRGDLIVWEDSAGIMHEYQKKKDAYITDLKSFYKQESKIRLNSEEEQTIKGD